MNYKTPERLLSPEDIAHENRLLEYLLRLTFVSDMDDLVGQNALRAVRVLREYDTDLVALREADKEIDARLSSIEATLEHTIPTAQLPELIVEPGGSTTGSHPKGMEDPFMRTNLDYQGSLGGGTPRNPLLIGGRR